MSLETLLWSLKKSGRFRAAIWVTAWIGQHIE